jgi:hypothetical protein
MTFREWYEKTVGAWPVIGQVCPDPSLSWEAFMLMKIVEFRTGFDLALEADWGNLMTEGIQGITSEKQ